MHFLLLGATGRTGKHVVAHALAQGHTAVALVRPTSSGTLPSQPGLTVVSGSPLVKDDIIKAMHATNLPVDAAIITLNTVRKSDSPFAAHISPPRFLADSCTNACAVLQDARVRRVVVMSSCGVGDSWGQMPWLSRMFMGWTNVKYALADHNLVDEEIRQTKMDWTLVRPVKLDYGEVKGEKGKLEELGEKGVGGRVSDTANAGVVAKFLIDVAVDGRFVKQAVVVRDRAV